ncbi:FAD/FMN-containing dehydrogenase [Gemmobacter megaterium]|uniref:FAD/FMN-containing dehydrogenase n=1 Tax=Gemmobacter megaterium TaxID=1086013 RepID=A0A1N7LN96_9RHOB|nr:FAD-binding oxidoreductase [Gemmobacter megaterium]GGE11610.1 D-2-hydroxyacid dehydrogenase [Gemmobacter megaterium]SIS75259.1 FAD/FMN-containing dehydrogenase [Gemmobacter megaterium]
MLNPADEHFVATLAQSLPEGTIRAPEPRHLEEPRSRWAGLGGCVALPRSTAEVASVVRACQAARVGIVPWGGGTGLVGGQVMAEGPAPVILSLERMKAVRGIWPSENVLIAEAGAKLAEVRAAADGAGRMFPLSLASEGTCSIGGNLATNAGGVNVLRWGNARDLCLGVEAVLADGSILGGLKRLRKDNTGYDLRNLLIGSEGTLGIITAASLRLVAPPPVTGAALMVVEGPEQALELLALAEALAPGCVSAFELIHRTGPDFLAETMPDLRQPFAEPPEWLVLVELGLPHGLSAAEMLEDLFGQGAEAGLVSDGLIAQSESQRADFWNLRENIPEANRLIGAISSHDVALPLSELPGFIDEAGQALAAMGPFRINCFGHLGDGNLHYNVFPPKGAARADFAGQAYAIKELVHDIVHARGGSVSAEHGLGRAKTGDLARYGDPARVAAMRTIKAALDPAGILNPGAVLV